MILVLRIEIVDLVLAGQNGQGTPVTCDSRLMSIYMHEKILIYRKYSRIGNILLSNNPIWSWETLNLLNIFPIFYQADYLATAVLVQVKISNTILLDTIFISKGCRWSQQITTCFIVNYWMEEFLRHVTYCVQSFHLIFLLHWGVHMICMYQGWRFKIKGIPIKKN